MRVLYILNETIMGGATISFISMLGELMENGVVPAVVVPRSISPEFRNFLESGKIRFYRTHVTADAIFRPSSVLGLLKFPLSIVKMLLLGPLFSMELRHAVKEFKPDVIHTNVGVIHRGLVLARRMHIPHVMHLREYQDKDFNWIILPSKSGFEKLLKKTDAVVTITDDIRRHFSLEKSPNACTVYNGIFHLQDVCYNAEKSDYFLCLSRIIPEKGIHDVVEAFSEFYKSHRNYRLVIAGFGDDAYINKLKSLAQRGCCSQAVEFTGYVSDVSPLVANAKALVVGSYNEGFGRMTAEACFKGCAVIGRNTAGTREILDRTGGLKFLDVSELRDRMDEVASMSDASYAEMVQGAQREAQRAFSVEQNAGKMIQLYKKILMGYDK